MAVCARNVHITVYDVTTWSWVNLVNPGHPAAHGASGVRSVPLSAKTLPNLTTITNANLEASLSEQCGVALCVCSSHEA